MNAYDDVKEIKMRIRENIWRVMERRGVARFPKPIWGRIPNFVGSEEAAKNVLKVPIFRKSETIFCNPDSPQKHVRFLALKEGKVVIMASPKLRKGFILLDPNKIPSSALFEASTIRGAFKYGKLVEDLSNMYIPLKVTGSVAVTLKGARLGKGGGYSDLEFAILREMGVFDDKTVVLTTVHEIQIVDEIPMTKHDVPADYIVTPNNVFEVRERVYEKPKGIYWDELDRDKIESIPILKKLRRAKI